jgi:hypothetical protein
MAWPSGRSAAGSTKRVVARARKASTRPRSKRVQASQTVLAPPFWTPGEWRGTPPGLTVVLSARSRSLLLRLYWGLVAAARLKGRLSPEVVPARPGCSRWVRAV